MPKTVKVKTINYVNLSETKEFFKYIDKLNKLKIIAKLYITDNNIEIKDITLDHEWITNVTSNQNNNKFYFKNQQYNDLLFINSLIHFNLFDKCITLLEELYLNSL